MTKSASSPPCIAGIDPGASGALAFLSLDREAPDPILHVLDLPFYSVRTSTRSRSRSRSVLDKARLKALLLDEAPGPLRHVFYEDQIAAPGQSVVALSTTFRNLGAIEALLSLLDLPHTCVRPSEWKASILRGSPKGNKAASVDRVLQLFPKAPVRGPRGGLLHDRAEAILIALHGRKALRRLDL